MFHLSYTPIPFKDESVVSMLFRCATNNGYSNLKIFNQAFELKLNKNITRLWQDSPTYHLLTLHENLTLKDKELINNAFHILERKQWRNFISINDVLYPTSILRQQLALCPSCMRAGHLNKMHTYRWSDVCPVHNESFIHKCPQCKNPFHWLKLEDYHCPCGFDLRMAPTTQIVDNAGKIIDRAMSEKNTEFFSLLMACMNALRYLTTTDNRSLLLNTCANIANGKKPAFFEEVLKLQQKFPSLHRRALLAPFILSENSTLSKYGMEFFFTIQQSRPAEHPNNCCCSDLLFNEFELEFIFASQKNVTQLKLDKRCISISKDTPAKRTLYRCPNICESLLDHEATAWDEKDEFTTIYPAFKLLNASEAAEILHTTPGRIRRLEKTGLLKAVVFHKAYGFFTSLLSLKEFNEKYILKSEIQSRTTLNSHVVDYLLSDIPVLKIGGTPYVTNIPVYRRNSLPETLLSAMNDAAIHIIKQPLNSNSLINFADTAHQLRVNIKDIKPMIASGLLKIAHVTKRGSVGRNYCTGDSLETAIIWRDSHLSLKEVATELQCTQHLVHQRFISSGFAEHIQFKCNTFVSIETSKKIFKHYKKFTTLYYFAAEIGCTIKTISNLITENKIKTLTRYDPNYINGHITIHRTQAKKAVAVFYSEKPRTIRIYKRDPSHI